MGICSVEPCVKAYCTKIKTECLVLSVNKWCLKFGQSQYITLFKHSLLMGRPILCHVCKIGLRLQDKSDSSWELGHGEPCGLAIQSQ